MGNLQVEQNVKIQGRSVGDHLTGLKKVLVLLCLDKVMLMV